MVNDNSNNTVDFSVIIPQRNSIDTLPRLFNSIPVSDRIEIIVVDNTPTPVTKEDIGINREYKLLWSDPSRHAGGARNVGLETATGKWLVFADADDYFAEGAFDKLYAFINSKADVIYFKMTGIYPETGEYSSRGEAYSLLVTNYLNDGNEKPLRLKYISPCGKMVRCEFINKKNIRYDEVRASNDAMFATMIGFYAETIEAVDFELYVATVSKGSLTNRRDFEVIHSRYLVALRRNQFLKQHGVTNYQSMVIHFLYQSRMYGFSKLLMMLKEAWKYKQNIFINTSKLVPGFIRFMKNENKNSKYIVK